MAVLVVVTNLPTVVVEASRIGCVAHEVPAAVHVIGADEITASGAHDVIGLLARKAPEVNIRRLGAGNPALAEIAMRGYGENGHGRTLVVVDGERLNSPDLNAPNLARIASGGVSKIEILGGPQSVLHGDGASAGIINVVTEPQEDTRRSYLESHVGSWGAAGAAAGTRGGLAEEGIRYWADGSYDRADGYRENSGYDLWNLTGGLRKRWENGTWLRVTGFYSDADYALPGALTEAEWRADPRASHATEDRFRRATYGSGATFHAQLDDDNALRTIGTFSSRLLRGHQAGDGWFSDNDFDIYSTRLAAEWHNTADLFGFGNAFLAGAQYAGDFLLGTQTTGTGRQSPHYDRQTMDFFAEETFRFAEIFAVQVGGRYSRAWSRNTLCERERRNDDLGAFEAALLANPTEASKLYVNARRFYRNPFLDEVPGRYDAGYRWVNTEILAPEKGWSFELGGEWEPTDELAFGADAYWSILEDEIFYNSATYQNENCADRTLRRGVDAHAAWERDKVAGVSLAASWVKANFDGGEFDRNRIPLVPELTLALNGRVWLWDACFLFGGYRLQGDQFTASDFGNDWAKLAWYGVFHLGLTYEPAFCEALRGLRVTLAVDNLLDERYCDYATYGSQYYPAAGRSLSLSVRYAF